MSTTSVNHSSISSIHRVDQAIDECDRNTCPNSLKRYLKFSCSCRAWLLFIQPSLNFVPQMINRVQIWTLSWPARNIDVILLQEISCYPAGTSSALMTCEMRHNMRSQNFIYVTGCCYSIASPHAMILEDNWTKFHVEANATPYHDAWTAPNIPFHHAVGIISFSSPSPQSCSAICG